MRLVVVLAEAAGHEQQYENENEHRCHGCKESGTRSCSLAVPGHAD